MDANVTLDKIRRTVMDLRRIDDSWGDWMYTLEKCAAAYDLLLTRYAVFHVGDRVRLAVTPEINEKVSPGWLGSKHFLVAGALGTIKEVDLDVRAAKFRYAVEFDDESWLDEKGNKHVIPQDARHVYSFTEDFLTAAPDKCPLCGAAR